MGVIFLTLYIDLIGFSIIFPLGPDLIEYYLKLDGQSGLLGWMLAQTTAISQWMGHDYAFAAVLFGGVISSFFSILQFIFAPFWGALSDRHGRRGVLRWTVAGTALSYLVWVFSGSFWLFMLSRLVSGAFSGNLSVATAAVADVTTRQERSRAMGVVGAAFGLGLTTGPMLGAFTAHIDLAATFPALANAGLNPFSMPALIAFGLCVVNLIWISARFKETLTDTARAEARDPRLRNPIAAIFNLENADVRRTNVMAFVYSIAFVAMETSLTFLAAERFDYTARQNGYLLGFLGICSIIVQGWLVRKLLKTMPEIRVLTTGLIASTVGLLVIGFAVQPWMLYAGLAFLALGNGFVQPSTAGLISLYSTASEQGRVLGIFRSLGALSRAITPIIAGTAFFLFGGGAVFVASAALALGAWALGSRLTAPVK